MILARDKVLEEIKNGNIAISPFNEDQLGPASYDLKIGHSIRVFLDRTEPFEVHDDADFEQITKLFELTDKGYEMRPGETVLALTDEKIKLAPHIAGWLEGRSRFARVGLMVHISAPFMQPGIDSRQVLEIANLRPHSMTIFPGTKLCQFIFEYCEGKATYHGRFSDQNTA